MNSLECSILPKDAFLEILLHMYNHHPVRRPGIAAHQPSPGRHGLPQCRCAEAAWYGPTKGGSEAESGGMPAVDAVIIKELQHQQVYGIVQVICVAGYFEWSLLRQPGSIWMHMDAYDIYIPGLIAQMKRYTNVGGIWQRNIIQPQNCWHPSLYFLSCAFALASFLCLTAIQKEGHSLQVCDYQLYIASGITYCSMPQAVQ